MVVRKYAYEGHDLGCYGRGADEASNWKVFYEVQTPNEEKWGIDIKKGKAGSSISRTK